MEETSVLEASASVSTEELLAELTKLRRENLAMRNELAKVQGVALDQVTWTEETTEVMASPKDAETLQKAVQKTLKDLLEEGINWPAKGSAFWDQPARKTPQPLPTGSGDMNKLPQEKDQRSLHIVHITAEMAPIAKVGGLGDVVTGLAKSCLARGHYVTIMLPFYECLPKDQLQDLKHECDIDVPKGKFWDNQLTMSSLRTSVFSARVQGCPMYLVRPADQNSCNIFRGGRIYGGAYNEMEAYLYFCRASLEYLRVSGQQPHVLQLHDWHAAAVSMLYWERYNNEGLWRPRVVLTIHNMDNTGECRQDEFSATGIPGEAFATIERALDERTIGHNPERLNLMKGGMVYSNAVTTVSPSYAKDILNGGAGGWLRGLLARDEIRGKFSGILNGIDVEEWDPTSDPLLPANYNAEHPEGKALCKRYLQEGLGLEVNPNRPLVAVVSRLVPQKGIHLIKASCHRTVQQGGQFVLLGSGHSDGVFKAMASGEFKDHPQARLQVMYSERLAHLIYAAADMVVVPSMFEPCGLTQLIAMRYGAIPVVRKTGGLADTVTDVDAAPAGQGNGYSFDGQDENSLFHALDRAVKKYQDQPKEWQALSLSNMRRDVSWGQSAKGYVNVYNSIALNN